MDIYQEVSLFFDEPIEQVRRKCAEAHIRLHHLWKEAGPLSERHRDIWYKTTDAQIYEQANWHQGHLEKRREIAQKANGEILCFGAGIGTEGIIAAEMGKHVTFYDLPGLTYEFLKFRVVLRKLKNVKFIEKELLRRKEAKKVVYEDVDFGKYDTIICIDVLEHLEYPQEMLDFLGKHLTSKGVFFVSAPFHALAYFSYLKKNNSCNLNQMMERAGIKNFQDNVLGPEGVSQSFLAKLSVLWKDVFYKVRFIAS